MRGVRGIAMNLKGARERSATKKKKGGGRGGDRIRKRKWREKGEGGRGQVRVIG